MSVRYQNNTNLKKLADVRITLGPLDAFLCNDRAVFIPQLKTLIIADLHIGKATYFRQSGIAIPTDVMTHDLKRLEELIDHYQATHLIIAGDFFHANFNREADLFNDWRCQYGNLAITLVRGNHDKLAKAIYARLNIELIESSLVISEMKKNKIIVTHEPNFTRNPTDSLQQFLICGHIHPGVCIGRRKKIKLPCYLLDEKQLILPAFSKFTGLDTRLLAQHKFRDVYAITEDAIIKL